MVWIPSLAQELPHAAGAAIKQNKTNKQNPQKNLIQWVGRTLFIYLFGLGSLSIGIECGFNPNILKTLVLSRAALAFERLIIFLKNF